MPHTCRSAPPPIVLGVFLSERFFLVMYFHLSDFVFLCASVIFMYIVASHMYIATPLHPSIIINIAVDLTGWLYVGRCVWVRLFVLYFPRAFFLLRTFWFFFVCFALHHIISDYTNMSALCAFYPQSAMYIYIVCINAFLFHP